jgi:hypothetical protein
MSQNDFNIANQGFPSFRSDLNSALQALASTSSGDTEPTSTYANQLWYDTAENLLKIRSEANDAWINVAYVDQSATAWRVLDDTQVVNTSGTQTGLLGDQTTATWEAGTGTTESLVSPAKVKAANVSFRDANAIGSGQTWQEPTRAKGTTYQNTTGRPIMVFVQGENYTFEVGPDGSTWLGLTGSGAGGFDRATWAVIPDATYYRARNDGSGSLIWKELR